MQMKNLGIDNELDRISSYIEVELNKVGLSMELIQEILESNEYELESIINQQEPLHLFKYAIKGKIIANSLRYFLKIILEQNPHLNEMRSTGDLSRVLARLKIEWIPTLSQGFSNLLKSIESEFRMVNQKVSI